MTYIVKKGTPGVAYNIIESTIVILKTTKDLTFNRRSDFDVNDHYLGDVGGERLWNVILDCYHSDMSLIKSTNFENIKVRDLNVFEEDFWLLFVHRDLVTFTTK